VWLRIALRWRRRHAVAMAGRDAMHGRAHVGGMHVHVHLRFSHQTTMMDRVRASQPASRTPNASMRSVVREVHSTSTTSSSSHTTRVRVDRNEAHRVFLEHRFIRRTERGETNRVLREDRAFRIGPASRPAASPRPRRRASQPTVGTRVIAALCAQAVPMLHPAKSTGAIESRHEERCTRSVGPRVTAFRATPRLPQAVRGATQRSLSPPQSMARQQPELVWRAPTPAMPAATATPTMSARTTPPAIYATTAAAGLTRIEAAPETAHVRAAVRAQVLDPALVERLSDDVIRRIERHARIERERRGL
jgi:hypothetical protein